MLRSGWLEVSDSESETISNLGQSLLRGEGEYELPVSVSILSTFKLSLGVIGTVRETGDPATLWDSGDPITGLSKIDRR